MKNTLKFALCASACITLSACAGTSGPRYVPRPDIPLSQYTDENRLEDYMDTKHYYEYEQREPCQHYRRPPRNMMLDSHCDLVPIPEPVVIAAPPSVVRQTVTQTTEQTLPPIVSSYTIYFDFDKSNVRASEQSTLARVAREIDKYEPMLVTVTGFTDTSGSVVYNQALSARRADSVTKALSARGIDSQIIDEKARGESELEVPTGDGVKLQENRRVVIDFRK